MIKTDGTPTIAWADPTDIDPVFQILQQVYDKYESGAYQWVPYGGPPQPHHKRPGIFQSCVGMACFFTNPHGEIVYKHIDDYGFTAEYYLAAALTDADKNVGDVYQWNDALNPKSAKRSILRLIKRAMELRKKEL